MNDGPYTSTYSTKWCIHEPEDHCHDCSPNCSNCDPFAAEVMREIENGEEDEKDEEDGVSPLAGCLTVLFWCAVCLSAAVLSILMGYALVWNGGMR